MKQGWVEKKLGQILQIERGGSPRPIKKYLTDDPDGLNWIKIGDATASTKYIYHTKQKITKDGLHKTRLVKEGDFILSNSMSFGKPYIMKTTGCIHDGWLVLKEKDGFKLNQDFLYHLLCSPYLFKQFDGLAAGSTVRNLNIALVSSVTVRVPPLEEQKQIVAKLDQCFEAIDKAKANASKNLENAKELFQSKLNEIFSQKGEGWIEKKLIDICERIFAGGDKPAKVSKFKTSELNIPIFSNGEKNKGLYGYTDNARVDKPSVTISGRGTIGYSEIREEPFVPIVRLITLIPNSEIININFLHYGIQNIDFINSGSSIPQLTVPMVKSYSISITPLEEQKQIVKILDSLKEQTQSLESKYQQELNSLEELKKSILQKAFEGEL